MEALREHPNTINAYEFAEPGTAVLHVSNQMLLKKGLSTSSSFGSHETAFENK